MNWKILLSKFMIGTLTFFILNNIGRMVFPGLGDSLFCFTVFAVGCGMVVECIFEWLDEEKWGEEQK